MKLLLPTLLSLLSCIGCTGQTGVIAQPAKDTMSLNQMEIKLSNLRVQQAKYDALYEKYWNLAQTAPTQDSVYFYDGVYHYMNAKREVFTQEIAPLYKTVMALKVAAYIKTIDQ